MTVDGRCAHRHGRARRRRRCGGRSSCRRERSGRSRPVRRRRLGVGCCAQPAGHARPDPAAGHRRVVRLRRACWWPVPSEADRVIEHALQVGSALLAVEQVGAGQHLLDLTVEYAKTRLQFGRPIGSFQAIKHKLADLLVDLEHARSTAYHAVWALTDGSDDPALAVSIAQATALGRVGADRGGHRPGPWRDRVHLGTPGASLLQTGHNRCRAVGQCRGAPVAGCRTGARHRRVRPRSAGGRRLTDVSRWTAG